MPRYRTQVAHSLGQREAIERIKANAEKARGISDLEGSWSGNSFTFAVSIQGIRLKGTIEVEDDLLKLESQLPLLAMPFVGWLPRILNNALKPSKVKDKNNGMMTPEIAADTHGNGDGAADPIVLFLHLPKAGGTTLGEFVYNQCCAEKNEDAQLLNAGVLFTAYGFIKEPDLSVPLFVRPLLGRTDLRAVIGHFWFGIHEYVRRPWTYITLLRDPVERVVSLYHYLKLENEMSLERFVLSPPYKEVDNDQTRRIAGVDPEIGGCTIATLRSAQENLRQHFSAVGTTERFDETLVLFKRKFGWKREILSYPRNMNPDRPPTRSLSNDVIDAIRGRNELDLELWQYANHLLDEAIAAEGTAFRDELESYQAARPAPPDLSTAPRGGEESIEATTAT